MRQFRPQSAVLPRMIAEIPAIKVVARASKETGNVSLYHDNFSWQHWREVCDLLNT